MNHLRSGIAGGVALLVLGQLLLGPDCSAQESPASGDSLQTKGSTLLPFPFYMYSPETKSGLGMVVTYFHRPPHGATDQKPSTFSASVIGTQRKQLVLGLGMEHYWSSERYQLQGGVAFSRFPDTFFGIGNDTDADVSEDYTPRTFLASVSLRREVAPDLRVGPNFSYADQTMKEVEPGGVLDAGDLPGSQGGKLAQAGISAGWDRRDDIVYPRSGYLLELGFTASAELIGSDFDFTSWNLDVRRYYSLSGSQVIAVRGLVTFMMGTVPFQSLATLGGESVMRGYYAGRFRERQRYVLQSEYRLGFWKRMGLTLFADVGDVAHEAGDFRLDGVRFAGGVGLRILLSKSEGATLRADLGTGDDGTGGVYLSILEAY